VVLSARESDGRILAPSGLIGRTPVASCDRPAPGAVTVDTVRRFKGLDAKVVIVIASPELCAEPELAYVATSRARTQFVAIVERNSLEAILKDADGNAGPA